MDWGPLLTARDAMFVKLQYGDLKREVADACRELGVTIIDDPNVDAVADIDAFAAQVAAMDLVITTSNATAHMAGSLNVPVWTLVPTGYGSMWHWFRNRDDSPWYPSMRLFRQPDRSAWGPVLHEAAASLTCFLASWKG
jgi:ADP-heptose:LPS heptosyltransferase